MRLSLDIRALRGQEYAFKGCRSVTASTVQGVRVEAHKIHNSRKEGLPRSVSKSQFVLKLPLDTHVARDHAVGEAGLRSCWAGEHLPMAEGATEDNKGERPGAENIPSALPAQRGPLGSGSPVPSLSHCGPALSSAVVASTW